MAIYLINCLEMMHYTNKTMSRITTRHDMDEYTHRKFKIFVFTDEDSLKRKIRLHMLENENEKRDM